MREIVYKCDKCKKSITGKTYGLMVLATEGEVTEPSSSDDIIDFDLCEKCMTSLREIIRNYVAGIEEPETGKTIDDGKIKALRDAGWTLNAIAEEIGCSVPTVSNHLEAMGYKKRDEVANG